MQPLLLHSVLFWFIYFALYLPICLKQTLLWLYLWQKKQYRLDKMLDYLGLPESKGVVLDKWTTLRLSYVIGYASLEMLNVLEKNWVLTAVFTFILFVWVLESAEFVLKFILKKQVLMPNFTLKGIVFFLATSITIWTITYLVSNQFFLVWLNIVILAVPLISSFWCFVFFPITYFWEMDYYKKTKKYRKSLNNLKVVAISGAYGKTTTKELLDQILSTKYKVGKTLKNQNANISCAKRLMSLTDQDYFLCELGSYNKGDGAEICEFVLPNIAIITGLNLQHYSLFGSKENILTAETESLEFLKPGDLALVNWSSKMCREINFQNQLKVIKYGVLQDGDKPSEFDIYAQNITFLKDKTSFELVIESPEFFQLSSKQTFELQTNLLSTGNIENLVGTIAFALTQGLKMEDIQGSLTSLQAADGTLSIVATDYGYKIDDSYNANFDGIKNALQLLHDFKSDANKEMRPDFGKKYQTVLFVDDILELGEKSVQTHLEVAKLIHQNQVDYVFLLGRNFAEIVQKELLNLNFESKNIFRWNEKNTAVLKQELANITTQNQDESTATIVLFEGFQSRKFIV